METERRLEQLGVFSRFNRDPEHGEYEDFCRSKLVLHYPLNGPEELVEADPETGVGSTALNFITRGASFQGRSYRTARLQSTVLLGSFAPR